MASSVLIRVDGDPFKVALGRIAKILNRGILALRFPQGILQRKVASPPKSTIARVREKALKTARDQVDTAIAELE
jgi:hypothetical protein